MPTKSDLHPLLVALLDKLADSKNSMLDCHSERFDWYRAGCPIDHPNNPFMWPCKELGRSYLATTEELDAKVESWHRNPELGMSLQDWLGLDNHHMHLYVTRGRPDV